MTDDERNIYEIARYVGMPGDRIEPFMRVLEMCGYEMRKRDATEFTHAPEGGRGVESRIKRRAS